MSCKGEKIIGKKVGLGVNALFMSFQGRVKPDPTPPPKETIIMAEFWFCLAFMHFIIFLLLAVLIGN